MGNHCEEGDVEHLTSRASSKQTAAEPLPQQHTQTHTCCVAQSIPYSAHVAVQHKAELALKFGYKTQNWLVVVAVSRYCTQAF